MGMSNVKQAHAAIMRSMLGRARGLGSAKSGIEHWWFHRVTSVALIPLTLWFVYAVIHLAGLPREAVVSWAHSPVVAALLLALIWATFTHLQMGVCSVMEDYIRTESRRLMSMLVMKGAAGLLGLTAAVAVLKLALAG
jgi:succinate dehydrogenase / fumarate reductase membrane anchor subunit